MASTFAASLLRGKRLFLAPAFGHAEFPDARIIGFAPLGSLLAAESAEFAQYGVPMLNARAALSTAATGAAMSFRA